MPPELIIFDCDGVLIDSEGVANGLIARELTSLGWEMTMQDSMELFLGMSISDMQPLIETRLGRKLPPSWRPELAAKLVLALGEEAKLIAGAREMLERVTELGIPWRIASNSSDQEMAVKFARTGLSALVEGKTHSAASVIAKGGRPKPAPDVFLAAAAAQKTPPKSCLVLEDSALGVTGAVAAGMTCYGFAPHGDGAHLRAAGATEILRDLHDLFGVLA
ncbi:HAD family hydrolase [Acidocella sp.]|jgi:HAD superfamily hydrolase (TIGR01509 family)|uniref:HAD family hydrolase n=1 Tax=Acidocella sp. TaxID=50710 RepID=UPI002F3E4D54